MAEHADVSNAKHQASSTSSSSLFSRRPSLSFFGAWASRGGKPNTNPSASLPEPPQFHQSNFPAPVPSTPPRRGHPHAARNSFSSSVAEIGTTLRRSRSASLRTDASSGTRSSHRRTPSSNLALSFSPEKTAPQGHGVHGAPAPRPTLSISTFARSKQKSAENVKVNEAAKFEKSPLSAVDNPKTPFGMAVPIPLRYPPSEKEIKHAQQRQHSYGAAYNGALTPAAVMPLPSGANPHIVFQHIQELASKRISTFDYLRKAHEGRIYWFNTLLFAKSDLTRLPSFNPRSLARRATNYFLLGFSLPTVLDLHSDSATDYLKALNALLIEFETYQTLHPPDGSTPSSLSRGRIPQMFKRPNLMGGKGRRSSAASDMPLLTPQSSFNETGFSFDSPPTEDLLLPNETYTHLQTPHLPFDPDFYSTFATLCDVLIDCYTKILSMLSTPESVAMAGAGVPSVVGDLFSKADAKIRKIILAGVVKEFEDSCRQGVKAELGGVSKVVLGGLM